jgi:hypothetical protein
MFTTAATSIDQREQELVACERVIGRLRARQLELLRSLDADQVTQLDGSRTMADWTAARLDVTSDTARSLVRAAKTFTDRPDMEGLLAKGEITFDRAVATAKLAASGASEELVGASAGYDLSGVVRLAARHRRLTPVSEREAFSERHVAIQPNLDLSQVRGWFTLPGFEGEILTRALEHRADAFPEPGDQHRTGRGARMADALVSIAQDSLERVGPEGNPSTGNSSHDPLVSVFVDEAIASPTAGEAGAEIVTGVRVGPMTLERMLCGGRVQLIGVDDTKPVWHTRATRAIPPATRRFVLHRDGGCVVDGCSSRYRLQVHHVRQRSRGGGHEPENLVTLCWYHHQVAIHGEGYRIDPDSPSHRRRLLPPIRGPDPPL